MRRSVFGAKVVIIFWKKKKILSPTISAYIRPCVPFVFYVADNLLCRRGAQNLAQRMVAQVAEFHGGVLVVAAWQYVHVDGYNNRINDAAAESDGIFQAVLGVVAGIAVD